MLPSTIRTRLANVAHRRFNSTSTATPPPPRPGQAPKGQGLDQPKAIFWGWAALVVVAGFGYFAVKSNNTAKKRDFMIKQGQELQRRQNGSLEDGSPAPSSTPVLMSSSNQEKYAQSPLQSLTAAFNRQTTQRSRGRESNKDDSEQ
ncbi:hypothetical protein NDA11_003262 [Ustilago hordei]|nr:hypothetical protein NDA15_004978 [Ustilago hordei]KAJ1587947.1 hypothetical protein NDA12_002259 [Ustilago hordei]KAJ1592934.1 hypothetical protein NDA11_003262 [Ustilago hordei]KAJ1601896.1 hypothetical protein NDA14_007408 [Ustilago hordei]UTT93847.1 hypothetical protein NDA17_001718 [Ustilago hordei]